MFYLYILKIDGKSFACESSAVKRFGSKDKGTIGLSHRLRKIYAKIFENIKRN